MSLPLASPIDLTTTLRVVPKTGSPSSQDYNDSDREILTDLSTISFFINDVLIPLLSSLPAGAAKGLAGDVLNSSSDSTSSLFFSKTLNRFLTVSEVLSQVNSACSSLTTQFGDLTAQVSDLRSKLATTNQNDLVYTIQSFTTQLSAAVQTQAAIQKTVAQNTTTLAGLQTVRVLQNILPLQSTSLAVTWPTAFPSNNYTASVSLEDSTGSLQLLSKTRLANGVGFTVQVQNNSTTDTIQASIQAIAKAD